LKKSISFAANPGFKADAELGLEQRVRWSEEGHGSDEKVQ